MAALDPRIDVIREKYGLAREDFWELPQKKGTWIAKHSALEVAAAKANIVFDNPVIIEANAAEGIAAMAVCGVMAERREWATGEASPKNNKNTYPWAMAEKRAKDRVILKLIGIHGLVYSEDEGDFKSDAPTPASAPAFPRLSAYRATQLLKQDVLLGSIDGMKSFDGLSKLEHTITQDLAFIPLEWERMFLERIELRRQELNGEEVTRPEVVDPNAMLDRQFADTMGDPPLKTQLKMSVALETAAAFLRGSPNAVALKNTWDDYVEGRFAGEALEKLRAIYEAKLKTFVPVGAE